MKVYGVGEATREQTVFTYDPPSGRSAVRATVICAAAGMQIAARSGGNRIASSAVAGVQSPGAVAAEQMRTIVASMRVTMMEMPAAAPVHPGSRRP